MFPELPSLDADEEFLRAIGGIGGLCDCGDADDAPASLAHLPDGWAFFRQHWRPRAAMIDLLLEHPLA